MGALTPSLLALLVVSCVLPIGDSEKSYFSIFRELGYYQDMVADWKKNGYTVCIIGLDTSEFTQRIKKPRSCWSQYRGLKPLTLFSMIRKARNIHMPGTVENFMVTDYSTVLHDPETKSETQEFKVKHGIENNITVYEVKLDWCSWLTSRTDLGVYLGPAKCPLVLINVGIFASEAQNRFVTWYIDLEKNPYDAIKLESVQVSETPNVVPAITNRDETLLHAANTEVVLQPLSQVPEFFVLQLASTPTNAVNCTIPNGGSVINELSHALQTPESPGISRAPMPECPTATFNHLRRRVTYTSESVRKPTCNWCQEKLAP